MLEIKSQHLTWGGPKTDIEANSMALVLSCTYFQISAIMIIYMLDLVFWTIFKLLKYPLGFVNEI